MTTETLDRLSKTKSVENWENWWEAPRIHMPLPTPTPSLLYQQNNKHCSLWRCVLIFWRWQGGAEERSSYKPSCWNIKKWKKRPLTGFQKQNQWKIVKTDEKHLVFLCHYQRQLLLHFTTINRTTIINVYWKLGVVHCGIASRFVCDDKEAQRKGCLINKVGIHFFTTTSSIT